MISRDTIEKRIAKITAAFHERVHMFTLETQRHESAVAELERLLPLFDSVQDLAGTQPPTRPAEPLSDVILRILQDARQPLTFDEIDAGLVCEGHVTTNARLASIIGFMECASLSKVRALRDGDPVTAWEPARPETSGLAHDAGYGETAATRAPAKLKRGALRDAILAVWADDPPGARFWTSAASIEHVLKRKHSDIDLTTLRATLGRMVQAGTLEASDPPEYFRPREKRT